MGLHALRRGEPIVALALAGAVLSGCASGDDDPGRSAPVGTSQTSGDLLPEATFEVLGGDEQVSTRRTSVARR